MKKTITLTILTLLMSNFIVAQNVSVTSDQPAEFSLNGQSQGDRSEISFKLTKKAPSITVKIEKKGYVPVERKYSNLHGKPVKSDHIKLVADEAFLSSVEGDFANKSIVIETGMDYEDAWKYLAMIVRSNFEVLETSDKDTGFMQSAWYLKKFNFYTVRQRATITQSSLKPLMFTIRIDSEITTGNNKEGENYRKWDRVLKSQADMFVEVQNRLRKK